MLVNISSSFLELPNGDNSEMIIVTAVMNPLVPRLLHEFVMLMREEPYGRALSSTFAFAYYNR